VTGLRMALLLGLAAVACTGSEPQRVETVTEAVDATVDEIRVAVLEVGSKTNLEIARYTLRGELSKQRTDTKAAAVRDPQFYPAPAGFVWVTIEPAVEVVASTLVSGERLALVATGADSSLPLADFRILGEEGDEQGARALRLRPLERSRARFAAMCRDAMNSQIVFVARGRVLLAVDVRAPVAGDFWITDLPERGVSPFVDRLSRIAEVPR